MCGRYKLTTEAEKLRQGMGFVERPNLRARYNVAPTQDVPVLRQRRNPAGERTLQNLRWGLIPSWAQDTKFAASMINARSETLETKQSFAAAFRKRRCLVPADGFYEWKGEGAAKQPYLIARCDGAAFAFAGLWDRWIERGPEGEKPIDSFTIITTAANNLLRPLHERMPVILAPEDYAAWLDPDADPAALKPLLRPAPEDALSYAPVSRKVNSARIDEPDVAMPEGPSVAA